MIAALSIMKERGCQFIVGGRAEATGEFETLEKVMTTRGAHLQSVRDIFVGISEEDFRVDMSSTELRSISK